MSRRELVFFTGVLLIMGAGWGLTQPLSKIAVSTGYRHFGLIFWQLLISAFVLGAYCAIRGRRLSLTPAALRVYAVIALIGTVVPNAASYQALIHLPAGVQSVLMSLVPMAAFPIALLLSLERFEPRRFAGLCLGLIGVLVLVLPRASLPDPAMLPWVAVSMIAVVFYAFEGNYVARWGLGGLDAIQVILGASLLGMVIVFPLALGTGAFINPIRPYGAPEVALIASSLIHAVIYATYVWLVGRAGSVFTAQVGYAVTATGIFWAMVILSESYSPYFWLAAGLILAGVFLVQPRRTPALAVPVKLDETGR